MLSMKQVATYWLRIWSRVVNRDCAAPGLTDQHALSVSPGDATAGAAKFLSFPGREIGLVKRICSSFKSRTVDQKQGVKPGVVCCVCSGRERGTVGRLEL
ncbi:hypothetical protein RRG08_045069 [Elysia crispata]|uniref:Uncharacterized protein n=1 Tax=Elysia crispata TaxID=231223 RepID=A0AAE1CZB0_9GAST|nr:hypothetical protein RRG08_045069 [Elysia crispata]